MAKLISSDLICNGLIKKKHWILNDRFELIVEEGASYTDFYILDKNDKYDHISLIRTISRDLNLYDDRYVRLLPKKDICGISVINDRSDVMFALIEKYLLGVHP